MDLNVYTLKDTHEKYQEDSIVSITHNKHYQLPLPDRNLCFDDFFDITGIHFISLFIL